MSNRIYKDFNIFSRALVGSKDVDPTYFVIKRIIEAKQYQPEWFAFCYTAFYSLETAIKMCDKMPTAAHWDENMFEYLRKGNGDKSELTKFGHERRGTARNVNEQIKMFNEIVNFVANVDSRKNPTKILEGKTYYHSQQFFREGIQKLPQHSVWASFKLAEIFEKALGYSQFTIPDLGLDGRDPNSTDGPVGGLRLLFGTEEVYDSSFFTIWNSFGRKLSEAWNVDIGEIETACCKWYKFHSGKYYIGHDIDEFQDLREVLTPTEYRHCVKDFDPAVFSKTGGVNKVLKSAYKDTSVIHNSYYATKVKDADVVEIMLSL